MPKERQAVLKDRNDTDEIGPGDVQLVADLYPLCRSITGDGLRATLKLLHIFFRAGK